MCQQISSHLRIQKHDSDAGHLPTSLFDYDLPQDRIAFYPLSKRDESKLLVVHQKQHSFEHAYMKDIASFMPERAILICNNTKVIPARLFMRKETGGVVEVFLTEPIDTSSYELALNAQGSCLWKVIIRGNVQPNAVLYNAHSHSPETEKFSACISEKRGENSIVRFSWNGDKTFRDMLESNGTIPLPPYIKRPVHHSDTETYQTIFAAKSGAVAAPTAGLHFTDAVFQSLANKGIEILNITLHVGLGTFKPVTTYLLDQHVMHPEQVIIQKEVLEKIVSGIQAGRKIIALGTTVVRSLESLYWLGMKSDDNSLEVFQNDEKKQTRSHNPADALANIIRRKSGEEITFRTSLMITLPYRFRIIDGMITNFHQPRSTLLALVDAFLGESFWKDVYREAKENNYRFLSYGDASLLLRN